MKSIADVLSEWSESSDRSVTFLVTGQNTRTEMYSSLEALVEDPLDGSTRVNDDFINQFKVSDKLLVCGAPTLLNYYYTCRTLLMHYDDQGEKLAFVCCKKFWEKTVRTQKPAPNSNVHKKVRDESEKTFSGFFNFINKHKAVTTSPSEALSILVHTDILTDELPVVGAEVHAISEEGATMLVDRPTDSSSSTNN